MKGIPGKRKKLSRQNGDRFKSKGIPLAMGLGAVLLIALFAEVLPRMAMYLNLNVQQILLGLGAIAGGTFLSVYATVTLFQELRSRNENGSGKFPRAVRRR